MTTKPHAGGLENAPQTLSGHLSLIEPADRATSTNTTFSHETVDVCSVYVYVYDVCSGDVYALSMCM
jgi:hypothetical protein